MQPDNVEHVLNLNFLKTVLHVFLSASHAQQSELKHLMQCIL